MSEGLFHGDPTLRPVGGGMYRIGGKELARPSMQFERQTTAERQRAGRTAGSVRKAMALIKRLGL